MIEYILVGILIVLLVLLIKIVDLEKESMLSKYRLKAWIRITQSTASSEEFSDILYAIENAAVHDFKTLINNPNLVLYPKVKMSAIIIDITDDDSEDKQ